MYETLWINNWCRKREIRACLKKYKFIRKLKQLKLAQYFRQR